MNVSQGLVKLYFGQNDRYHIYKSKERDIFKRYP